MIKNSRQASVSRKTREELLRAAEQAPPDRRSSYLELAEEIERDLGEYDAIQAGRLNTFEVESLDNLGESLVKARLARGWTHRQLASALDVSEQMVQRDEAQSYEHAGLSRMAEVADVLGYNLAGSLRPVHLPAIMWQPALSPTIANVSVGVLVTGLTWTVSPPAKPQIVTSGVLLGIQAAKLGNAFDPMRHLIGGRSAGGLSSIGFMNTGFGSDTFDSAATVPLELTGEKL